MLFFANTHTLTSSAISISPRVLLPFTAKIFSPAFFYLHSLPSRQPRLCASRFRLSALVLHARFSFATVHIAVFGETEGGVRSLEGCLRGRGRRRSRRDSRRGGSRGRKRPGTLARQYLTVRSFRRLLSRLHLFFELLMRSRRLTPELLISVSLFHTGLSRLFVFRVAVPKLPSVLVYRNASRGVVAFQCCSDLLR